MIAYADAALLALAAAVAGALNAMAGGGSFLTLPALIAVGVPPVAANATGTLALLPGYLSASWGSRRDLAPTTALPVSAMLALALSGGIGGALLLMLTPDRLFASAAPWLVLAATLLFAAQPLLHRARPQPAQLATVAIPLFAVCLYGGYFNGGLGILLLATLVQAGIRELNAANALKNRLSAVLTAVAVCVYATAGTIHWQAALWMMLFATLGGYLGARGARRLPAAMLRFGIVIFGLAMAAALALY